MLPIGLKKQKMTTKIKKLEKIVRNFAGKKILILGDLMLDEYIFGKTTRLSPEAPVPIVETKKIVHLPGGAANAANNVKTLGDGTILTGIIGKDENGKKLIKLLKNKGIKTAGIFEDSERPTTLKSRIVSEGQHIVRIDKESRTPITRALEKKLLDFIKKTINNVDIVLISDYAKGVITPTLSQAIINLATKADKRVLVDPKGEDFSKYQGCSTILPNLKELEIAMKIQVKNLRSLPQAEKMLLAHVNSEAALITLSANGMALLEKSGKYTKMPAPDVKVVDISGAGDTAIASFALSLAAGATFQEAMSISTYACSVVIGKLGTATVTQSELVKAFKTVKLKKDE